VTEKPRRIRGQAGFGGTDGAWIYHAPGIDGNVRYLPSSVNGGGGRRRRRPLAGARVWRE